MDKLEGMGPERVVWRVNFPTSRTFELSTNIGPATQLSPGLIGSIVTFKFSLSADTRYAANVMLQYIRDWRSSG